MPPPYASALCLRLMPPPYASALCLRLMAGAMLATEAGILIMCLRICVRCNPIGPCSPKPI
jgi:hypothetical protein